MAGLPVIPEELTAYEQRLGVRLPDYYKRALLDETCRRVLAGYPCGLLVEGKSMADFAELTETMRRRQPEFPRAGVVIFCGTKTGGAGPFELGWGYLRFLLPDPKDPTRLGDKVYSWSADKRRQSRSGSVQSWIGTYLSVVDPNVLAGNEFAPPPPAPPEPLRLAPCPPELLAALALRGEDARRQEAAWSAAWFPCGTLAFKGAFAAVCDLGQTPNPSVGVKLTPGDYQVFVSLASSRRRDLPVIAKLRLIRAGADMDAECRHVHSVDVDLAAVAVYDRQVFFRKFPVDDRDLVAMELMELPERIGTVDLGKGVQVFVAPSGDGDGSYPVFELLNGSTPVGLEVRFQGDPAQA